MASVNDGLSFAISHHPKGFKLVELPSQLLQQIKSGQCSISAIASLTEPESTLGTVLCTDAATYIVRQVQSSNSVFVLQPSESAIDDPAPNLLGLTAISQCTNTLELVATCPDTEAILRYRLPIFDESTSDTPDADEFLPATASASKKVIEGDVPSSGHEFDAAWRALCAFEDKGRAWRPSSRSCLALWKSLLVAVDLQSYTLEDGVDGQVLKEILHEDGFLPTFVDAFIELLRQSNIESGDSSKTGDLASARQSLEDFVHLDKDRCLIWVAQLLLDHHDQSSSVDCDKFLQDWRDILPECWRDDAVMKLLQGTPAFMRLSSANDVKRGEPKPAAAQNAKTGSRRWHEKFGASRK